jgi:hypothetical protein
MMLETDLLVPLLWNILNLSKTKYNNSLRYVLVYMHLQIDTSTYKNSIAKRQNVHWHPYVLESLAHFETQRNILSITSHVYDVLVTLLVFYVIIN